MTYKTLKKIHDLLNHECKTQESGLRLVRENIYKWEGFLAESDKPNPEAETKLRTYRELQEKMQAEYFATCDALKDFETQDFR